MGKLLSQECGIDNSGEDNTDGNDEMQEMIREAFGVLPIHAHDMGVDDPPSLSGCYIARPFNPCSNKSVVDSHIGGWHK